MRAALVCSGIGAIMGCSSSSESTAPRRAGGGGGGSDGSGVVGGAPGGAGGSLAPVLVRAGGSTQNVEAGCASGCQPVIAYCGDGVINQTNEACDDGNTAGGDGCTAACDQIEEGWICPTPGESCANITKCGDRKITGSEQCDDGNTKDGDGCNPVCKLEAGYVCPVVGAACRTICGDRGRVGNEQCDDGNTKDGDGCSARCQLEPGYVCDESGACKKTVCGNGIQEGTEQCDDTAAPDLDLPFDGCYHCLLEPDCASGSCQSPCGDGQRFSDEECDDGNTFDGDGCSSTCKIETGFHCSDTPNSQPEDTKDIPVVVRDFIGLGRQADPSTANSGYHIDFNRHYGAGNSIFSSVKPTLGANGKPAWRWLPYKTADITTGSTPDDPHIPVPLAACVCNESTPETSWDSSDETWSGGWEGAPVTFAFARPPCSCSDGSSCTCDNPAHLYKDLGITDSNRRNFSSPSHFVQWYTHVDGVNLVLPYTLRLLLSDAKTGSYSNISSTVATGFDPISSGGWIAAGKETPSGCGSESAQNVSFTTETRFWFEYQGGEHFAFSGDDDTWVFINRTLVVDLGSLHGKEDGWFTLDPSNGSAVAFSSGHYYDGVAYTESQGANVKLGLVLGKVYEVAMFQAERNQCGSNFGVTLKNFSKPKSVCTSVCGDGIVASSEYCDDGVNTSRFNGCGPGCIPAPYCGDAIVQSPEEECDDGLNVSQYGGCAPGCKLGPSCGDGRVQSPWEDCDDGLNVGDYGKCAPGCHYGARCGDGIVQAEYEECDDGLTHGGACRQDCKNVTIQ